MTEKTMKFKSRKAELVKFAEAGDNFIGKIERFDTMDIGGKEVTKCFMTDVEGRSKLILLTSQLEALLSEADIGKHVRITYQGKLLSRASREVSDFDLEVEE